MAVFSLNELVSNRAIWAMIQCRVNAATAQKKPTAKASMSTKVRSLMCFSRQSSSCSNHDCPAAGADSPIIGV